MNVYQANPTFNFDKLQLQHPISMPGNSYFTSITMAGQPVYIETPQITTKQGFVKNVKKIVCDLLFSSNESDFIQWIETLETTCHNLVYKSSGDWFQDKLEYDDIENAFSPCMKSYKSGKYQACRCLIGVDHKNGNPLTKVYDETETPVSHTEINEQSQIIGIVEIKGIRFTTRSFQIEIDLRQAMILKIDTVFDKCLIKKGLKNNEKTDKVDIISLPLPNYQKTSAKEIEQEEQHNKDVEDVEDVEDIQPGVDSNDKVNRDNHNEDNLQLVETNYTDNNNNISNTDDIADKEDTNEQKDIPEPKLIDESIIEEVKNDVQSVNNTIEKIDTVPENKDGLEVVDWDDIMLAPDNDDNNVLYIKRPNQVYHEIYKKAKERSKRIKKTSTFRCFRSKLVKKHLYVR